MRVFNETQQFTQWWLWLVLAVSSLAVIGKPIVSWAQSDFENSGVFDISFWIGCGTMILVLLLFVLFKLTTGIDEKGIRYQFFPIHLKPKMLAWDKIEKIGTRTYKPLIEFGGWGYRWGIGGKALNVKGNKGIQVKLKNGNSLLIGTQKVDEAQNVINRYFKRDEGIQSSHMENGSYRKQ